MTERKKVLQGRPFRDLHGQKFGRLVVLGRTYLKVSKIPVMVWDCICECGRKTVVRGNALSSGFTKSCGCLRSETVRARHAAKRNAKQ